MGVWGGATVEEHLGCSQRGGEVEAFHFRLSRSPLSLSSFCGWVDLGLRVFVYGPGEGGTPADLLIWGSL